jgi:hypothetical protein
MHLISRTNRARRFVLGATLTALMAAPTMAGVLAVKVTDVSLSQTSLFPGQSATLSYNILGSGLNVAGGFTGTKVEFISGATVAKTLTFAAGTQGALPGANAVTLKFEDMPAGGPYTIKVTANGGSFTASGYTQISSNTDPYMAYWDGRGVDVNRRVGSPAYGRIYVTNGAAGSTTRNTPEGMFVLNPDLTPYKPNFVFQNTDIGVFGPWGPTSNSPYRVVVDQVDDTVYLPDASDGHSAVLMCDRDATTLSAAFVYPDGVNVIRDSGGLVTDNGAPIYGSTMTMWVDHSGSSRTIYTTDEDALGGMAITRYSVGTASPPWSVMPDLMVALDTDWVTDLVRDSAGNTYFTSWTADTLRKYDKDFNLVASNTTGGAGCYAIAMDEAKDIILLGTNSGKVLKTNKALAAPTEIITGIGTNVRDVAIDGEGWIYALSSTDSLLRVFVPAGTYGVATGETTAAQTLTVVSNPIPGDIAPVGPTGLYTGPNGQKYGDGKVNILDAAYALRVASGLNTIP